MYLSNSTRPDITSIVRFLASLVSCYTDVHVGMVKRVLSYLLVTAEVGLWFAPVASSTLSGFSGVFDKNQLLRSLSFYSDSSWADNYTDGTSNSGMCVMFMGCLILWRSVKQKVVARSSMESEYIAMSSCVDEIRWCSKLAASLSTVVYSGVLSVSDGDVVSTIDEAVTLFGDNQASICVGNSDIVARRSRHINVDFHNVKHAVVDGVIKLQWIASADNLADFFTKCLGVVLFKRFRAVFMQ
jgi:hypothetical protein